MAGFYNPFSAKPDYASGLQDLAYQVMQFLAATKEDKPEEKQGGQQFPPPTQPQQRSQQPMMDAVNQAPAQMQNQQGPPQGPPPQQPQMGGKPPGGKQAPEAAIMSLIPPELQRVFIEILKQAKFQQPSMGGGQRPQGR